MATNGGNVYQLLVNQTLQRNLRIKRHHLATNREHTSTPLLNKHIVQVQS